MGIVTVCARLTAHPGQEDALLEATVPLIAATRAEQGCLRYDLVRADETPTLFQFLEEWESHEALAKHLATEHIGAFRSATGDLLAGVDVATFADVDVVRK